MGGTGAKAEAEGLASLLPFQRTRWFGDEFRAKSPEVVEKAERIFLANATPAYVGTCRMLGAADLRSGLGGIRAPTAILVGAEDYATPPEMAEAMRSAMPGATLQVIENARHFTPLEIPDRIAAEIAALADRAAAGAPTA